MGQINDYEKSDITILFGIKILTKFTKYNGMGDPTYYLKNFIVITVYLEVILLSFKQY